MAYNTITVNHFKEKVVIKFGVESKIAGSINDIIKAIKEEVSKEKGELVLDLNNIKWITSMEIGLLMQMYKILDKKEKKLSIVNAKGYAKNALESTGTGELIKIYNNMDEVYGAEKKGLSIDEMKNIEDLLK